MKTWTTALALIAAGTMLAGSAFAQATAPSGDQKDKPKSDSGTTGSMDSTKSGGSTSKSSTDMKSSDSMKSGDMKSSTDTKASDSMKSDAMKGDKSAAKGRGGRMAAGGGNGEQVRAVQQALKDKGHDPGDIDGKMGPKTQAALRDYQSKEGLKATGRVDAETMAKLGIEGKTGAADTSSSTSPSALPKSGASSGSSNSSSSTGATSGSSTSGAGASSGSASPSTSGSSSAPSSSAPGASSGEKK